MTKVSRNELLHALESVDAARTDGGGLAQSGSFCFKNGRVITFDDEMCCKARTPLPRDLLAVVCNGDALLSTLRSMTGDEVRVGVVDGPAFRLGQGRRWAKLQMETEILLPLDKVERPGEWLELPADFSEAAQMVAECVNDKDKRPVFNSARVTPGYMEGTDYWQYARYYLEMPVGKEEMVRGTALRHVAATGATHCSVTDNFLHFKNGTGLVTSVRRLLDGCDYPDAAKVLKSKGERAVFPKMLSEYADFVEIFSGENKDDNKAVVDLRPGELRIRGEGVSGKSGVGPVKVKYDGKPLSFRIGPKVLSAVVKRHTEATVNGRTLRVEGKRWAYVTNLSAVGANGNGKEGE